MPIVLGRSDVAQPKGPPIDDKIRSICYLRESAANDNFASKIYNKTLKTKIAIG